MASPEEVDPHRSDGDGGSAASAGREPTPASDAAASPPTGAQLPQRPANFVVRCPACGSETLARSEEAGKRGRCAACGETFHVLPPPGTGVLQDPEPVPQAPPFEGPPHRAPTIVAVGLAAILSTAIATVVTSCCPYIPVDVVGLTVGIVAAVMARRDLRAMDRGAMDPAGRERTRLGFALGVCAAGLSAFLFLLRFGILAIAVATALLTTAVAPAPPVPPPATAPPKPVESKADDGPAAPLDVQNVPR